MIKPTWLYKPVIIENLQQIQKECIDIYNKHYSESFGEYGFTFTYIDLEILRDEAPSYITYLKELGLYDKWVKSIFVGTKGDRRWDDSQIHVDSEDWETRSYALNIPVINCEDSYTVWYDVTEYDFQHQDALYKAARGYDLATSTEIGRMPASKTALINVAVAHRPVTNNPNTRLLISTRFYPEIHDYFKE